MTRTILDTIVDEKKREIQAAKAKISVQGLLDLRETRPPVRGFVRSILNVDGNRIIAEIKRASPSKGDICENADPVRYADAYTRGGAAAISALTDPSFFKGGTDVLIAARKTSPLPVLRKDFIIDPYQVYEAASMGADALLLIVRILSRQQLGELLSLTRELGMDALVEVHSEADVAAAADTDAKLIGINNRNLASFDTDIGTAGRIQRLLPGHQTPVAASGIHTPDDIIASRAAGIDIFLIGESLMRTPDPEALVREFACAGVDGDKGAT